MTGHTHTHDWTLAIGHTRLDTTAGSWKAGEGRGTQCITANSAPLSVPTTQRQNNATPKWGAATLRSSHPACGHVGGTPRSHVQVVVRGTALFSERAKQRNANMARCDSTLLRPRMWACGVVPPTVACGMYRWSCGGSFPLHGSQSEPNNATPKWHAVTLRSPRREGHFENEQRTLGCMAPVGLVDYYHSLLI